MTSQEGNKGGQEGNDKKGLENGDRSVVEQSRLLLSQQAFVRQDADNQAAPSSRLGRYGEVTIKGIGNLPAGIGHAIVADIQDPVGTLKMVATSAAMGAVLKTVLPEGGAAGKIAAVAIGGYFMYKAAEPVMDAYSKAGSAKTMKDINLAATQLGDAGGSFLVNSAVSGVGYKLGAGAASYGLMSERMDGFAIAKNSFWNGVDSKINTVRESIGLGRVPEPVGQGGGVELTPRYRVTGDRAELLRTERTQPQGILKGDTNPNEDMSVTVMLRSKAPELVLDRHLARIAAGRGDFLTEGQFARKFGADPTAIESVGKFAADNGLKISEQNLSSGRVVLKGNASQFESAFNVKLQEFEHPSGVTFRGRSGTISVPTELAPNVEGVFGLDTRPQLKTHFVRLKDIEGATAQSRVARAAGDTAQPNALRSLTPEEVFKAYNASEALDGKGLNTAFISLGGTLPEGWESYLQKRGIDPKTVKVINTSEKPLTPDPRGANGENALDMFIHKQGLPKGTVTMVAGENSDAGFVTAIERSAFPKAGEGKNVAVSISWGAPEDQWTPQAIRNMELTAKKAAVQGVTITAASGDDGAVDRSPSGKAQTDFPSSSQWITGVGGTTLQVDASGKWSSEKTWSGSGATGGGRSLQVGRPDYQKGIEMPPNIGGSKFDGRGVPDIAFNADPRTGWKVFTDEGIQAIGGTSASSPAAAVIAAKIAQSTGKPVGFWNPALYEFGKNNPSVFRDVINGNNDGYSAGKGWDATTGWGSINVQAMLDSLGKNQSRLGKVVGLFPALVTPDHNKDKRTGS